MNLIYTDHHVHTSYSPDSDADIKEYLIKAKSLGLKHIMFTDHMDFGNNDEFFQNPIDYDEYFKTMKYLEEEYQIGIQVGVEIGYDKNYKNEIDEFLKKYPFDFVIGSVHSGEGEDFYSGDFFTGKTQEEAYLEYFEILLEMVENFTNFDVAGHIDYITRYGGFDHKFYDYEDYKEIIDNILKAIIKNGKGIEVNTSGLRGELNTTFPKEEVLKRYKELGGSIITIGSDSHFNKDYHADVLKVIESLESLGFTEISSFTKRKIERIVIG